MPDGVGRAEPEGVGGAYDGDAVGGVGGEGEGVCPRVGVVGRAGEGGEGEGATVAARAGVALDDGEAGDVRESADSSESEEGGVEGDAGAGVGAGDLEEGGPRAVVGGAPEAVAARGVGAGDGEPPCGVGGAGEAGYVREGVVLGLEGAPRCACAGCDVQASVAGGEEEGGGACRAKARCEPVDGAAREGGGGAGGGPRGARVGAFADADDAGARRVAEEDEDAGAVAADGDVAGRRGGVEARPRGEVARGAGVGGALHPEGAVGGGHADANEGGVGGHCCGVVEGLLRAGVTSGGVGARDTGQHVEGLDADVGATGRGGLGGEQGVGDGAHFFPYAPRTRNCRGSGRTGGVHLPHAHASAGGGSAEG